MRFTAVIITSLALMFGGVAHADETHTLVMNGTNYTSTQVSGPAWHFETPGDPQSASVPERNQTWTGNGADHLPCPNGIHWISNENVLTISHCLGVPEETTTTTVSPTTVAPTTSTEPSTSTTTVPESSTSTTLPASTTTVSDSITTLLPTTTTSPSTTELATTTSVVVETTVAQTTTTEVAQTLQRKSLPETGDNTGLLALSALGLILIGGGATVLARRR